MSTLGHQQARETGRFLDNFLSERNLTSDDITWMSSPFVRCLQTSDECLNAFDKINTATLPILPEYSIFEWDGHGGEWHQDLPPLEERKHYFPRVDTTYKSFFTPTLPEPRSAFEKRCQQSVNALHTKYPYQPRQVIVLVSHAAGCIMLAKTLTKKQFTDITPAGPCSIYGFTRTSNTETWSIDEHNKVNGLNGYSTHLSMLGSSTPPWNNFGDGTRKFYTGPPTSRFAPIPQPTNIEKEEE